MISILDRLNGHFLDGQTCESSLYNTSDSLKKSVRDNIWRLMNSKRDMQLFAPEAGISDAIAFVTSPLQGKENLRQEITQNIELYEPRLQNVRCMPVEFNTLRSRLIFRITGSLDGARAHFQVEFGPDGQGYVLM